jgi:hypothetical protein
MDKQEKRRNYIIGKFENISIKGTPVKNDDIFWTKFWEDPNRMMKGYFEELGKLTIFYDSDPNNNMTIYLQIDGMSLDQLNNLMEEFQEFIDWLSYNKSNIRNPYKIITKITEQATLQIRLQ